MAKGTFEAKCVDGKVKIRNRDVSWEWHDDIDANTLQESGGLNWINYFEALWDVVGDEILDTDFNLIVNWKDKISEETYINPMVKCECK